MQIIKRDANGKWSGGSYFRVIGAGFSAFILLIIALNNSPVYTVGQGERAVITRLGGLVGSQQPGLHVKFPFIDQAHYISVQPQTFTFESMLAYSADQQPAELRLSVTMHVIDPEKLYVSFHTIDNFVARVLNPRVAQGLKVVFGQFTAVSSIQRRGAMDAQINQAIRAIIPNDLVIVDSVQIENIDFSDSYEKAVEAQMQAQVAQRTAEAMATRTRTMADANAYAAQKRGEGEAAAIKARGEALRENPGLPALVAAEKWDGKLPSTMPPGASVPFLQLQAGPPRQ